MTEMDTAGYNMERIMRICTFSIWIWLMYILCLIWIPPGIPDIYFFHADTAYALSSSDSDSDGLPDWWENRYGGNLSPAGDSDGDGVSNLNEYKNGAHPLEADTDGDGINDFDEISRYGTDPLLADTDRGGNSDRYEISSGGNPLNPDDDDNPGKIFSIALHKGMNLFSLPVTPANTGITSVLAPISGKYAVVHSCQGGKWLIYDAVYPGYNDLNSVEPGKGYWIEMTEAATLTVSGSAPPKSIPLYKDIDKGWNLVGYNSGTPQKIENAFSVISGKISAVWMFTDGQWKLFDPVDPPFSNLFTISPAYGYWIQVKEDCTWTLP